MPRLGGQHPEPYTGVRLMPDAAAILCQLSPAARSMCAAPASREPWFARWL